MSSLREAKIKLMKTKSLILGLALATGAFAQNSLVGTIATFNAAGSALDNQQKQAAIAMTQAAAGEAHATAAEAKPAAALENQDKAAEAQLAEARHQLRIEHLKVLAQKAKQKHPDFDETISHLSLPTSQAMLEAILDSELGAEIMYWLAKHPADCKLIGDLQPLSAVREIGRIEGTIAPLAP
jgi:hypothetical protein